MLSVRPTPEAQALEKALQLVLKHPGHDDQSIHGNWARGGYEEEGSSRRVTGGDGDGLKWTSKNGLVDVFMQDKANDAATRIFGHALTPDIVARTYTQGIEKLGPGHSIKLNVVMDKDYAGRPQLMVAGHIYNENGDHKGYLNRTFSTFQDTDGQTKPTVHNDQFDVAEELRGTGFGAEMVLGAEEQYRKMGVAAVTVSAQDVGGYAWAVMGFGFASQDDRLQMVDTLSVREAEARNFVSKAAPHLKGFEISEAASKLRDKVQEALFNASEPWEMAALKVEFAGQTFNVGKRMVDTAWDGIKYLDERGRRNKAASDAYLQASRRKHSK